MAKPYPSLSPCQLPHPGWPQAYGIPSAWQASQHWHPALLWDHMLETFPPAATPHAAGGGLARVVRAGQPPRAGHVPPLGHGKSVGLSAGTPPSQPDSQ